MRKYTDFHERKLTSAEVKKREEIAKAIEQGYFKWQALS